MKKAATFILLLFATLMSLNSCAGKYKCTDANNDFFENYAHKKK